MALTKADMQYLENIGNEAHREKMKKAMTGNKPIEISSLMSSAYFFLDNVFIVKYRGDYRLVVSHYGLILYDASFFEYDDARAAFLSEYKGRAFDGAPLENWSHFYPPAPEWLEKQLAMPVKLPNVG